MPAAGMAGIMKAALALFNRRIPPTLHAERPAKALIDSRFELPQTAIDWEEDKYPLVAGVNAFGFGGINSHVIMTAYDNKPENLIPDNKIVIKRSFRAACLVGAHTKEELLTKIDKAYWAGIEGKYKLIIFDPTDERIEEARSIVEKDKPWKGEMDIWFSNEPLLEKDGKLAFLFPESNTETDAEVNTIANYFELEHPGDISNLLYTALKRLKVAPDMNIGHSTGDLNRETKEKARVFIQIGTGSLNGFADNIPQDEKYSVISTCHPDRSGIEQLRRVLALLFIEGKEVDVLFIRSGEVAKVIGQELELEFAPFVTEFPLIKEVLKKQRKLDFSFCEDSGSSNQPLAQKVSENMREISLAQKEMLEIMNEVKSLEQKLNPASSISQTIEKKVVQPVQVKKTTTAKKTFNEEIIITTKDYPYITDHTVVKQPDYWTVVEDLDVVIPMTMSIEMMMEIAEKHAPARKVIGLSAFSIFQWMNVFYEFKLQTEGRWVSDNLMKLEMKNFITTEIMLGDEYPVPPQKYTGETDLGKKTQEPPTRHFIYTELMFHGPCYQGIEKVTEVNEHGMKAVVKAAGGKASLLDTLGQLISTYLRITVKENNVCFPVSVGKITFYQDFHDQSGIFDFTLVVTEINDDFINGDMILKRNGSVWCIAENWLNRRFEMDDALWDSVNIPLDNRLGKQLEGTPVVYFDLAYSKTGSWPFIEKRYLNREEKAHLKGLLLNKRRPYTISRIAIKDAIRTYLIDKYGKKTYPIEITIDHDEKGKPFTKGLDELKGLEISLSHKGNESVALASEKPVGVDIERIEERSPDFMDLSFTEEELAWLKGREQSEWATRFWAAKEAYGKMLGVGLEGNPKKYKIERIEGDSLFIGRQEIHTVIHKEKYIVAWIIRQI
jgi:phosphopantetheinyl transferase (holo-ACP synthase)